MNILRLNLKPNPSYYWTWIKGHQSLYVGIGEALILAQLLVLLINVAVPGRPIMGLKLHNHNVTLQSQTQLDSTITSLTRDIETKPLTIHVGNYTGHVSPRQLGAKYDNKLIKQEVLKVGRAGSIWHRIYVQDAAVLGYKNTDIGFSRTDKTLTSKFLVALNAQIQRQPVNARFAYQNGQLAIIPQSSGFELNIAASLSKLATVTDNNPTLVLPTFSPTPKLNEKDLQPLLPEVKKLVSAPLIIMADDKQITVTPEQIATLIQPVKQSDPVHPSEQKVSISYNDTKLSQKVDELVSQVDRAPTPTITNGNKIVTRGSEGVHVDGTHAKVQVIAGLEKRIQSAPAAPTTAPKSTTTTATASTTPTTTTTVAKPTTTTPTTTPTTTTTTIVSPTPTPPISTTSPAATAAVTPVSAPVVISIERVDPPVISQYAQQINPLGRYPAMVGNNKMVYLTFDDGPGSYTEAILDILKHYNVHAIFFVVGKNVTIYPQTAKRMINEGHTVGNHSYAHRDFTVIKNADIIAEISKTQTAIKTATGVSPDLFRPPYGAINANVQKIVSDSGLNLMMWTVDPRDWSEPGADVIAKRVIDKIGPGSNVLLHTLHSQTVQALPAIIEGIRAKGFTLP